MPNETVLAMRGICKSFPGVRALHNVDFTLRCGDITQDNIMRTIAGGD